MDSLWLRASTLKGAASSYTSEQESTKTMRQ